MNLRSIMLVGCGVLFGAGSLLAFRPRAATIIQQPRLFPEAERLLLKKAYREAMLEHRRLYADAGTTYEIAEEAAGEIALLERWRDGILEWKLSTAHSASESDHWRQRLDADRAELKQLFAHEEKVDHGSSSAYVFGFARAGMLRREIEDMLLPPEEYDRRLRIFESVKSATGNFMGQEVVFTNGVADCVDTSEDWSSLGDEYAKGFPLRLWFDKRFLWETEKGVVAFLGLDTEAPGESVGLSSDSMRKCLLALVENGKVRSFQLLKFDFECDDYCYRLDGSGESMKVISKANLSCIQKLAW